MYSSPNIIPAIISRIMRWAGHAACMDERKGAYTVLVAKPEGNNHLEDLDINGRIILE